MFEFSFTRLFSGLHYLLKVFAQRIVCNVIAESEEEFAFVNKKVNKLVEMFYRQVESICSGSDSIFLGNIEQTFFRRGNKIIQRPKSSLPFPTVFGTKEFEFWVLMRICVMLVVNEIIFHESFI